MELIQEYIDKIKGGDKYNFLKKLIVICKDLNINPNWLLAVMNSESGFHAWIVNPNGGATGLIQFMPATAKWLGTTTQALRKMSRVQQLDYVKEYYRRSIKSGSKIESYEDLYLLTFYPYALKKGDGYIFGSERSLQYANVIANANPAIDIDKNGYISKAEFRQFIYRTKVKDKISGNSIKLLLSGVKKKKLWIVPLVLGVAISTISIANNHNKKTTCYDVY